MFAGLLVPRLRRLAVKLKKRDPRDRATPRPQPSNPIYGFAAALAKSPAFTIEIFDGSIH
jgi:hypothetical protein